MSDFEGKRIRAYELQSAVGSGGFGTVYHAMQDVIDREVAVKVIRDKYANQPQFIRRFETEARIIARLEHPHIVPLYDYWRDPDGAYLIMRWLPGGSLRDRMKAKRFTPVDVVKVLNQIASALALAHSRDIIHRDIKPENILLDDQENVYLTDFGIAVDLVHDQDVAMENMSYGSPEYVAPEQLIEKKVSPQSDIYSLGIMLYEMLANVRPFSGASTQEIVKMQVRNPVPSLKLSRPDLPPEIDTIIWQATAKKPSARYDDVLALALAFQQVAADISDVPLQFRGPVRRKTFPTGNDDLSTGKMSVEALGTTNLATGNFGTDKLSSSDIDLSTADLTGMQVDEYGTADLSGAAADLPSYRTSDLSGQADSYKTSELIGVQPDSFATANLFSPFGTTELGGQKPPNPYKGLNAFQEEDAANFYGRETTIQRLLDSFRDEKKRFLALIGASGSGKSSLIRAGLIPELRNGSLPGSENWYITTMVPGSDPFQALTEALLRVAVNAPKGWGDQLSQRIDGLHTLLSTIMPEADAELVLFIDQFEEVFTLSDSEEMRQQFLGALYYALVAPNSQSRLRLIVTLRADYYDRPLNYVEFGELLRQNTEVVLPLSERDLEAAIRRPIEDNYGLIADNLVSAILEEVRHQPGALPLVQYALTRMYELASDNTLNIGLYEDIGGVSGALAQSASRIYTTLPENRQTIARQLFMRMVALGDAEKATRRRMLWSDLVSGIADRQSADYVINTFGSHRLLTLDNDAVTRAPTVDIAHEALIEKWDKFQHWIQENRGDLMRRQQLSRAVDEWTTSQRKADYLAQGTRLGEFESLLYSHSLVLSKDERDYLEASQELREQAKLRTRNRMIALAVLAVVAGIMAVVAVIGQIQAVRERNNAVQLALVSQSRTLAANANANLSDTDLSLLISVEAVKTNQTFEAVNSLLTSIQTPFLESYLHGHTDVVNSVAYSPDGTLLASAGADNVIRLWDAASRQAVGEPLSGHTNTINRVAFSPDGTLLASASADNTVRLWSIPTGEEVRVLDEHQLPVWALDFSLDGRYLVSSDGNASGDDGGTIIIWDVATGEVIHTLADVHTGIIFDVAFNLDGSLIASGGDDNIIRLWDTETGETAGELTGHNNWVLTLAFSPTDSNLLISSGVDVNIAYWDIANQTLLGAIQTRHTDWVRDVAFSADGQYIVSASHDKTVKVWTFEGVPVTTLLGHSERVLSIDFHPTELALATGAADGDVALWRIAYPQRPGNLESITGVVTERLDATEDRQRAMVFGLNGALQVFDIADNRSVFSLPAQRNGLLNAALSPNGQLLATVSNDGKIVVYNVEIGTVAGEMTGHEQLVSVLLFTADSQQLISADESGVIFRWSMSDFSPIETRLESTTSDGITNMAVSPDGQYLAVSGRDTLIRVWDLEQEEVVAELAGHENIVDALAFDQTNTRLISGGRDTTIIIWDFLAENPLQSRLTGHSGFIFDLAVSPNNRYLASASQDDVRLWDLASARQLGRPFIGHRQGERVTSVLFRDDETLLSTGYDRNLVQWDLNIEHWLEMACTMSNRNLTPVEWAQYIQVGEYRETCP
jgi:WD40 repeat protein/serine/threonine protein kinase